MGTEKKKKERKKKGNKTQRRNSDPAPKKFSIKRRNKGRTEIILRQGSPPLILLSPLQVSFGIPLNRLLIHTLTYTNSVRKYKTLRQKIDPWNN